MYALLPWFTLSFAAPHAFPSTDIGRWATVGHHVVAELAWERLSPTTRGEVRTLLAGDDFVHASTWADSIRPSRRATAPLHYVNIPIWEPRYDPRRHCPRDRCVIGAIEQFGQTLEDQNAPLGERAEALRFLIHFVGDIHQPLHVGDRSDRGGNLTEIFLDGRRTNLHRVWDHDVVAGLATSEADLIARLQRRISEIDPKVISRWESGSPADWAWEGHSLARDHAYRLPADGRIGRAYLEEQAQIVEIALLKGAVRLAHLLNRALDR